MVFDLDDIFKFATAKKVKVRHRYLGLLFYLLVGGTFLWTLVKVLIIDKKYLLQSVPTGTVQLSLKVPGGNNDVANAYCKASNGCENSETLNWIENKEFCKPSVPEQCDTCWSKGNDPDKTTNFNDPAQTFGIDWSENSKNGFCTECKPFRISNSNGESSCTNTSNAAFYSHFGRNSVTVATRIKLERGFWQNSDQLIKTSSTSTGTTEASAFVAGVEHYTLRMVPTVASAGEKTKSDYDPRDLLDPQNPWTPRVCHLEVKDDKCQDLIDKTARADGHGDILPISTLLKVVGIGLDEPFESVTQFEDLDSPDICRMKMDFYTIGGVTYKKEKKCRSDSQRTPRYDGLVLVVEIVFDVHRYKYDYVVKALNPLYERWSTADHDENWIAREDKGIHIIFEFGGFLGSFDPQNLFIQLVTGLGLISIAKSVVEMAMNFVLPDRKKYQLFTFEMTPDFKSSKKIEKMVYDYEVQNRALTQAMTLNKQETALGGTLAVAAKEANKLNIEYDEYVLRIAEGQVMDTEREESEGKA